MFPNCNVPSLRTVCLKAFHEQLHCSVMHDDEPDAAFVQPGCLYFI